MEKSSVDFGRTRITFGVRRSSRRKTVAVSVDRHNGVLLTAPVSTPLARLDRIVHQKARWIVEKMRRVDEAEAGIPPREFVSGESYLYLGRHYRLRVQRRKKAGAAKLDRGWLVVPVEQSLEGSSRAAAVREALKSWYKQRASAKLLERVALWVPKVGVPTPSVRVKDQLKRWGSCDARRKLRFNWRIIQAPMALVDYVVVHELVHLRYKTHKNDYWMLLGKVMPDYEKRREELRKVGPRLDWGCEYLVVRS